jgi:hypothetical protein
MANLWVVVTGLAVLVEMEGPPSKPCMVLLRQVPPGTEIPPDSGEVIPVHDPRLRLLPGSQEIPIGDQDVMFLPNGEGTPVIKDHDPFLRVGRELTDALKVGKKFIDPRNPANPIRGWSRVILSGPGVVWPIHVKKEFEVKTIKMQTGLKLVGAVNLELSAVKEKNKHRVGNGLLYYRHIPGAVPAVELSGQGYSLSPVDLSGTNFPVPNGEENYVVWVANSGEESGEEYDRDFYLLYDLLGGSITRYVPMIEKTKGFGRRTPPGQCMIGYAFG